MTLRQKSSNKNISDTSSEPYYGDRTPEPKSYLHLNAEKKNASMFREDYYEMTSPANEQKHQFDKSLPKVQSAWQNASMMFQSNHETMNLDLPLDKHRYKWQH